MRCYIRSIEYVLEFSGYCSIWAEDWTAGAGIYCVFRGRLEDPAFPIYIGHTGCIATKMIEHRNNSEEMEKWRLAAEGADLTYKDLFVTYAITNHMEGLFCLEPAMIFQLQPKCNLNHIGNFPIQHPQTHVEMSGPNLLLNGSFTVYPGQMHSNSNSL